MKLGASKPFIINVANQLNFLERFESTMIQYQPMNLEASKQAIYNQCGNIKIDAKTLINFVI